MRSLVLLALVPAVAAPRAQAQDVIRDSIAGAEIVGDVHPGPRGREGPVVLLFHQGGGNAAEYRSIAPRLVDEGYAAITFEIRGGGDRFDGTNRVRTPEGFGYCDAEQDVVAALDLARASGFAGPVVLWGSSYSATLVLRVAARRTASVDAVLAFSPAGGEPMDGCQALDRAPWLLRAGLPTLVLRPRSETELPHVAEQLEAFRDAGIATYVAADGAHGSSMLDPDRVDGDVAPQWDATLAFLEEALRRRAPDPRDRRVIIASGDWRLAGDLRTVTGRAPAVLLLHKAAGDRRAWAPVADALAERGIASLRIDLRGHGESTNRGRFLPRHDLTVLPDTWLDVRAALAFLRQHDAVDLVRIAIAGASYSGEAAARALRDDPPVRAAAMLSPGDFSDDSFAFVQRDSADWLFLRSDRERFVDEWLDAKIATLAPRAALRVVPAGDAHATDLLLADPSLIPVLADWFAARLR